MVSTFWVFGGDSKSKTSWSLSKQQMFQLIPKFSNETGSVLVLSKSLKNSSLFKNVTARFRWLRVLDLAQSSGFS